MEHATQIQNLTAPANLTLSINLSFRTFLMSKIQGLICPNCASGIVIPEGARIVSCPSCGLRSMVQGERGIRRWQVHRQVERDKAAAAVRSFFKGMNKARDLHREAEILDIFLVYLPYWRVQAYVAGWMFGRVKRNKDSTKPVEVEVFEEMHWNDAAVDVSEYGVARVTLRKAQLEPYDESALHAEAMVFEPAESRTEAMEEAHQHFTHRGREKRSLTSRFFEKFSFLRQRFSLVYYPLWVARYSYKKRHYQVVVDGVEGGVLYGKAPGNIFYRAAMLVGGMALGNLLLVNGCALLSLTSNSSSSDDGNGLAVIAIPVLIGGAVIYAGYRAFRYGEEVEKLDRKNQKAEGVGNGRTSSLPISLPKLSSLTSGNKEMETLLKTGMKFLDDM